MNEVRIARLNVSENLDAWSNYHLGLHHMYRFTKEGNAQAPGAHFLIAMIAVAAHSLNGEQDKAKTWASNVRNRRPDANSAQFFASSRSPIPRLEINWQGVCSNWDSNKNLWTS